jgi:hypothetical protein
MQSTKQEGEKMLSLELVGILLVLFGLVTYALVATQLEQRNTRVAKGYAEEESKASH